jgi:hypothetical protein
MGSFLPLMTLCLMRYRSLRDHQATRGALLILLAGFTAITVWEVAPLPAWIGHILLWDTGPAERWMFTSGLLLTVASLLIWSKHLISVHPFRITLFVLIGPVASFIFKTAWLIHRGQPAEVILDFPEDLILCGFALAACLAAWFNPLCRACSAARHRPSGNEYLRLCQIQSSATRRTDLPSPADRHCS